MQVIREVVGLVKRLLGTVTGVLPVGRDGAVALAEDAALQLVSSEGNAALKARFAAAAQIAKPRLVADGWFPLPSLRATEGQYHTVIASCIYFLLEDAMAFSGANLPAGLLQGYYLQGVLAAVPVSAAATAGGEDRLLTLVGETLADLICPAASGVVGAASIAPTEQPAAATAESAPVVEASAAEPTTEHVAA